MTRVDVDLNEDIISILNKLQNINDVGIDLYVPVGAAIFDNILNLKLLRKELEAGGHVVHFVTEDEIGNTLISMLDSDTSPSFMPEDFGDLSMDSDSGIISKIPAFFGGLIPKPSLPRAGVKLILGGIAGLAILVFLLYKMSGIMGAEVKVDVKSQSLTRSVSIKVRKDAVTDVDQNLLNGKSASTVLVEKAEIVVTGEKIVGEKAKGKVTIFNKTSDEVDLDKGTELNFDGDDEALVFVLTKDITIPALYEKDPTDPATVLIPGEVEADIEAADIGDKYNIEADETLGIDGYKRSEMVAEVVEDLEGGKSEVKKVVAEKDRTDLSASTLEKLKVGAEEALKGSVPKGQNLVVGSFLVTVQKETFNHEVGDETEKLELILEVLVSGLTYSEEDMVFLLDKLVEKSIPEEYVISEKDRGIKVDVLGNTDSSVLSSSEADLQVTSDTFLVPNLTEDDFKEMLKGKTVAEANKILGSIKDLDSYEIEITGGLPLFRKVPNDVSKINVEIVKSEKENE